MFEKIITVRGYLFCMVLFLIAAGCSKEPQYIPTQQDSDNLFIVETDTVQPEFTVYRLDSFQTSGSNTAIIGQNTDPYFGTVTAKTYCRFNVPVDYFQTVGLPSQFYDSAALIMHTNKTYTGDTTAMWNVTVLPLRQAFDATILSYYNHNTLLATTTELGNAHLLIRPNTDDSVKIKLSDVFWSGIFTLYKRADPIIQSQDAFQLYFKGLCIEPLSGNTNIYGFNVSDTGTYIRIYYHDDQGIHINKTLDFRSQGGTFQFNNIITDPTGSMTEQLVPGHDLLSSQMGHQIFVNDLAGVGTHFTLPSVKALPALPDFVRVAAAQLDLRPLPASFSQYALIPFLGLGVTNETNSTLSPLFTSDNTSVQNGNLFIDVLNGVSTGYQFDLAAYSRKEIASTAATMDALYLQPFSSGGAATFSLSRLVAGDGANAQLPSKLTMQLLFYKK